MSGVTHDSEIREHRNGRLARMVALERPLWDAHGEEWWRTHRLPILASIRDLLASGRQPVAP